MAQLVECLPSTQNIAGSNPTWLFYFSCEKEELSLGVVALLCLVSMAECTCTCVCVLIKVYAFHVKFTITKESKFNVYIKYSFVFLV